MKTKILSKVLLIGILGVAVSVSFRASAITIVPSGYRVEVISTGDFDLVQPTGLAIDESNNIYIGRIFFNGSSDLLKITPSGDVSSVATFANTFAGGLAFNNNGQLYGSLYDGSIFTYDKGTVSAFATGLPPTLQKLTFDDNNNLFVASYTERSVSQVSPTGIVTTFVSDLQGPSGVTFNNGSLFIADNLNYGNQPGIVREATLQGDVTEFFGPIPGRIIDLEYEPISSSFFVANQEDNYIQLPGIINVITNGRLTTFAKGFDEFPRDLAFDPSGALK